MCAPCDFYIWYLRFWGCFLFSFASASRKTTLRMSYNTSFRIELLFSQQVLFHCQTHQSPCIGFLQIYFPPNDLAITPFLRLVLSLSKPGIAINALFLPPLDANTAVLFPWRDIALKAFSLYATISDVKFGGGGRKVFSFFRTITALRTLLMSV